MKKTFLMVLTVFLLVMTVLAAGCSSKKSSSRLTGNAVASQGSDEPRIDRSYNVKEGSSPTRTTSSSGTRTTTTTASTTTSSSSSSLTDEERAEQIAKDYIKNLPGYKDFHGRDIKIKSVAKLGDGDFIVDAVFWRDPVGSKYATSEPINVHLNIRDWKGDSYQFN